MHETKLRFAVVFIVLIAVSLAGCALPSPPAVGASAPDFTLSNQERKPVSLIDYRGRWVVIYFYGLDFGQRSTAEARTFQRDLGKFDEANTVILGIGFSGASSHRDFADKEQLKFALLSDPDLRVARLYGSVSRRLLVHTALDYNILVIDPQGKTARVLSDFDADDTSGRVLTALRALQQQ